VGNWLDNSPAGCRLTAAAGRPGSGPPPPPDPRSPQHTSTMPIARSPSDGRPALRPRRAACRVSELKLPIPARRLEWLARPANYQEGGATMEEQSFDDLARGLDTVPFLGVGRSSWRVVQPLVLRSCPLCPSKLRLFPAKHGNAAVRGGASRGRRGTAIAQWPARHRPRLPVMATPVAFVGKP
jgi:hypothetical protein